MAHEWEATLVQESHREDDESACRLHSLPSVTTMLKEGGTSRRAAAEQAVKSVGGNIEAFYYAFGDTDAYVIVDVPDNPSMTALSLAISSSGRVAVRTTVLLTAEEVDEAAKKTAGYRAPGQ